MTKFDDSLIQTPGYNPTLKGNIRQIKKACDLIKQAKRPLILAGAGVIISNACCELKNLLILLMLLS